MLTIRQKLTLWFTLMVGLIIGLGAVLGALGFRQVVYHLATSALVERRQEIQLLLQTLITEEPRSETIRRLKQFLMHEPTLFYDQLYLRIIDHQGQVLLSSNEMKTIPKLNWPLAQTAQFQERILYLVAEDQTIPVLFTEAPVSMYGGENWQIQLGLSLKNVQDLTYQLLLSEIIVFIFSILLALGMGQWLAGKAMQPVQSMIDQVDLMSGEEMSAETSSNLLATEALSEDEIGQLARTFNALLERIARVFQAQKQFVADVSHEFNTPLTVIRGHAQILRKRGKQYPETIEKSTQTIIRESDFLTNLVDDLLLLNRLETQTAKWVEIDLIPLLEQLCEDLQPLYPRLTFKTTYLNLVITGNYLALRRLFLNLIQNALKATQNQGEVWIEIEALPQKVQVKIHDTGVGIAPQDLAQIFQRFYRVDYARGREDGGSGIGLALVKEVIDYHQGQIEVTSHPEQGSIFTVSLPRGGEIGRELSRLSDDTLLESG